MLKVTSLASGSYGNSILVSTSTTKILLDAGTGIRDLSRKFSMLKILPEDIDGIVLTHEHNDHSKAFWEECEKYIPNIKELDEKLKKKEINYNLNFTTIKP